MVNQVYSSKILFWSKIISTLLLPYYSFFNLFRKKYLLGHFTVKTILVTEYHRIGDILMIIPALTSLRKTFPESRLILLCNKPAQPLAENLNLADEIISVKAPWTEWGWSLSKWARMWKFSRKLSKKGIDLAFDFKGDLRNSWFLWHTNPKISYGYATTGGEYFFTNAYLMNQGSHQSTRANTLVKKAGCNLITNTISKTNINTNGAIVFHNGATDPRRSWPIAHWVKLAELLSVKHKISVVKLAESEALIKQLKDEGIGVEYFQGSIIDFKNWLKNQQCIISPDSMAGHLAAYIGVPTISIFGSQNPNQTHPVNNLGVIVRPDSICKHQSDHWRLCKSCMESISSKKVFNATINLLSRLKTDREI